MKKFEYFCTDSVRLVNNQGKHYDQTDPTYFYDLNQFGKEGWELVSVVNYRDFKTFYFKRELK